MITCEKRFGSFVRSKVDVYNASVSTSSCDEDDEFASSCVIPSNRWIPLPLVSRREYNQDTSIFEFALPLGYEDSTLALPVLGHLLVRAPGCEANGEDAIRPYTSISPLDRKGTFELLVKRYDEWYPNLYVLTLFIFIYYDNDDVLTL
jgi:Oxidoreductase FAD-binding domain